MYHPTNFVESYQSPPKKTRRVVEESAPMGAETEAALTLAPSPASVRVTCDCLLPYRVRSVRYYAQTAPGDAVV